MNHTLENVVAFLVFTKLTIIPILSALHLLYTLIDLSNMTKWDFLKHFVSLAITGLLVHSLDLWSRIPSHGALDMFASTTIIWLFQIGWYRGILAIINIITNVNLNQIVLLLTPYYGHIIYGLLITVILIWKYQSLLEFSTIALPIRLTINIVNNR